MRQSGPSYVVLDSRTAIESETASAGGAERPLSLRAAELAPEAGLEMLRQLPPGSRQATELELRLFEALGPSADSADRIVAALPPTERRRFRIEALARWAETDPVRAFQEALAIGDRQLRLSAAKRVAAVWAERDLAGAQAEADVLKDDNVGRAFRSAVVHRMSETDPAVMVSYVNASPRYETVLTQAVVEELRLMEPQDALRWAEQLEGRVGDAARRAALQSWGQEDPLAAFAYAQSMRLGDERLQLMYAAANGYGRQNPEGALAWVASQTQAPLDLSASVIAGIAQVDAKRALDLAFRDAPNDPNGWRFSQSRFEMLNTVISNAMATPDIAIPDLAARVLSLPDRNERSNALQLLTERWLRNDPRAVLDWLTTQDNVPNENLSLLVGSATRYDPLLAAGYTDRVPPPMRELWIANVAQNYARLDPQAAADWLGQFRDEREYAAGVAALANRAVDYDPALAAKLLGSLHDNGRNTQMAAQGVARNWAGRDEQSTRMWIRGLAEGPVRDSALQGLIGRVYRDSVPEASLLALFSSEQAKQQAIMQVIYAIGRDDRDEARRLVQEHISDPAIRRQAQAWLDEKPRDRNGVSVQPGGFIMSN
jgi:hypothetical protein